MPNWPVGGWISATVLTLVIVGGATANMWAWRDYRHRTRR